jgi:hypothetical protein
MAIESIELANGEKGPSDEWKIRESDASVVIDTNRHNHMLNLEFNFITSNEIPSSDEISKYVKKRYYSIYGKLIKHNILVDDEVALNDEINSGLYSKIGLKRYNNNNIFYIDGKESPLVINFSKYKGRESKELYFELSSSLPIEKGNIYKLDLLVKVRLVK